MSDCKKIQLGLAERADLIQIANEMYNLWSAGLSRDFYQYYLGCAYYQPWSKRNLLRIVAKDKGKVAASCKVVYLPLVWRGKHFQILGLGAIFTSLAYRGQGLATSLVKSMIETARQESIDGLLLFSDIDRRFYGQCDFVDLGNLDFEINNNFYSVENDILPTVDSFQAGAHNSIENRSIDVFMHNSVDSGTNNDSEPKFRYSSLSPWLEHEEINEILNCYSRWLSRQPYGIVRNHNYFTFQLARYVFIANYSKNNKPKLLFTLLKNKKAIIGYAISEYSQNCLRILEVIGSDAARAELWHNLIAQTQQMGLSRSNGFESVSRDFVPVQRLEADRLRLLPPIKPSHFSCYERSWGQPMFLALNNTLNGLSEYNPCPLLEFDYL